MYHQRVDGVSAFVLAGGNSTRMGEDKAFLELAGRTLLARALEIANQVADDVRMVGDAGKFLPFGRVVEDVFSDRGPLGGIHAALLCSTAELNLVLAVDLPFVESRFLEYLISAASQVNAVVTVPRAGGGFQPLCAVYRRDFAAVAEKALRKGKNKIDALFTQVETRVITEEELSRAGFSPAMFRNLNTRQEWEKAKLKAEAKGGRSEAI